MKKYKQPIYRNPFIRIYKVLSVILMISVSCESFVEVDLPQDQITGEAVFEASGTVQASLQHIYAELRDNAFTSGKSLGVSYLMGYYADELHLVNPNLNNILYYEENNVLPTDDFVLGFWSKGYNLIYATNSIIEGLTVDSGIPEVERNSYLGEAYFLRAYLHFYLVNLFGPVPYITSTDYTENQAVSRQSEVLVYEYIVEDLIMAKDLLSATDINDDNFRPDHWTAVALLARVYLYQENWESANKQAIDLISHGGFELRTTLDQVFLKDSGETIWQLGPGLEGRNTHEGFSFVVNSPPPNCVLSENLLDSFETGDQRRNQWVGTVTDGETQWHFPYKYKQVSGTETTQECSILFRLSEQYLIAAESFAQLGNITASLDYLNPIRDRAGLSFLSPMPKEELLDAISQERRVELFTEQAHRFFDLKRTNMANTILSRIKLNWDPTDILLPVPDSELSINPNLNPQNEGY